MFAAIVMLDGSVWLEVETEYDVPIHADAALGDIIGILQPWVDSGELGVQTLDTLASHIDTMKGKRMNVWDAFPQLFKDQSRSREELISMGLIEVFP
jgi:hypothetical protein